MNWNNGRAAGLLAAVLLSAALGACGGTGGSGGYPSSSSAGSGAPGGACTPASDPGGPYCLTFMGSAYDIHIGQKFGVALVRSDGSNTVVTGTTIAAVPSAAFTITLPRAMTAGVAYYVDYYVDENGDGRCTSPPADHVWRSHIALDFYHGTVTTVTAETGDISFSAPHDDPFLTDPVGMDTCAQLNQLP